MSTGLMIFLGLVFGAVFLLAQCLIVRVLGESARTRRVLQQRLRRIQAEGDLLELRSLLRQKYLNRLSPMARQLESLAVMERLARLIDQAGHSMLAHRLVLLSILIALVA